MKTPIIKTYTEQLTTHYESYFCIPGKPLKLSKGPKDKLHQDFVVLEFPPNNKHQMYCYCTVGMSADGFENDTIELFVYAPKADEILVELLTVCASYHRNSRPLDLHHTINIGQSWLNNSKCDHGFISLPYLGGQELRNFEFNNKKINCYWFIPITEEERDYKIEVGVDALEQLFEDKQLDYLNPGRESLINSQEKF